MVGQRGRGKYEHHMSIVESRDERDKELQALRRQVKQLSRRIEHQEARMKLGGSRRSNSDHEAELRCFYNPRHRSSQGNENQLWKLGMTRFHNWLKVARDCAEDYKPDDAKGLAFEVEAPIEINKVSNLDVSQFSLPSYLEIRCKEDKLGISLEEETQYGEIKFDCDKEPKFDQMVSAFDWIVPPIFDEYVDNKEVNLKNVNLDTFQDKTIEFVSLKNSTSLCQEGVCKSDSTRDILASTCALDVKSCVDQTSSNILMVSGNRDVVLGFKNGCTPQHIATHEQPKVVEVTPTIEFHDPVWYDFMHTDVTKNMGERKELLQYLEVDT